MGEYLPNVASNSAEVLLTFLQPSRSKKNADNKIFNFYIVFIDLTKTFDSVNDNQ